MKTWINVARYHMIDWVNFAVTCWGVLVIAFVINVALFASLPGGHGQAHYSGALGALYLAIGVLAARLISQPLPFALALGLRRVTV